LKIQKFVLEEIVKEFEEFPSDGRERKRYPLGIPFNPLRNLWVRLAAHKTAPAALRAACAVGAQGKVIGNTLRKMND
jgi:hypothetical protein